MADESNTNRDPKGIQHPVARDETSHDTSHKQQPL